MLTATADHDHLPWTAHYPDGVPPRLGAFAPLALPDLLARAAAGFGDRTALSLGDRRWTYAEFEALVARAAKGLQVLGVAPGDRVAVLMPNHPAVPVWFFATASTGAALVSINPLYPAATVAHMVRDSGATIILTLDEPDSIGKLEALLAEGSLTRLVTVGAGAEALEPAEAAPMAAPSGQRLPLQQLLANDGLYAAPHIVPDEALAVLQYTGGTTGTPKGAMLTHANLAANAAQIRSWFPFLDDGAERIFIPLPLSHITGITVCMTLAVELAAELIVVPRFVPAEALAILRDRRPTLFGGVPTIFIALLQGGAMSRADWTSVKAVICGGAPLPPDVLKGFSEVTGHRARQIYGSTELSPAASLMPARDDEPSAAVGLPLPGTRVEIRSTDDPRRVLAPGEQGEIVVAGPQVMRGYWNRSAETADYLVDGFFRTGDIGYIDANGYVFIVDRLKDMIIAGGYNVYPATIENAVFAHPAVVEAIVIGVPDAYRGETVKAFVVLKPGQQLELAELQAFLKDRLSPIEMPKQLEIRESLPKTAVGKLSRLELKREIAANG